MDKATRLRSLKAMVAQTAPEQKIESIRAPGAAGLEGVASPDYTEEMSSNVANGLLKLQTDRENELTNDEVFGLEAIILPQNRPVAFVRGDSYDDLPGQWQHLNGSSTRARLAKVIRAVGRIEVPRIISIPYAGTGFVVGKDLLLTNRHVARLFTDGVGTRRLRYTTGDAAINFRRQVDSAPTDQDSMFTVRSVVMVHPYWDAALLRVDGLSERFPALELSGEKPDLHFNQDVVAIGYPARDFRNDLALQDQVFRRTYDVKRVQPGKLKERRSIASFEQVVNAVTHDSSTLGGNSGSALVDPATGNVIGLHFAGEYLKANYAVPMHELARDSRVRELLRFTTAVPLTNEWQSAWNRADGSEDAAPTTSSTSPVPSGTVQAAKLNDASWTIPLHVVVSIGDARLNAQPAVPSSGQAVVEAAMKVPIIFAGLEHRRGFNRDFLNLPEQEEVPLPELTDVGKSVAARLDDGSTELKYHNFSVTMHKGRRLALFTASNTDWRDERRTIDGVKPTRLQLTGLPDGTPEQWVTDWRIAQQHQLPDVFFSKDGGVFDKGHVVRRDDVCWGSTFKEIQKANGDTFHTTNCSPQIAAFNQSAKGVDNWGDLENLVQQQTKAERAIVFAGPVLQDEDPVFEGKDANGTVLVRIPRKFWKVILVKEQGRAAAYGFVLEQDLSALPTVDEFAVPQRWRKFTRSVQDIEASLNGLVRLDWLKQHDKFGSQESARIDEQLAIV